MSLVLPTGFSSRIVGSYLSALASGTPAPGGGSAAGLAGAMGCALGEMVCNLTLARENSETVAELRDKLAALRADLLHLAERDEQVFSAYRDATELPRSTAEEKAVRRAAIEAALNAAADVPMQMIGIGLKALETLRLAAQTGSSQALGDLLTGGYVLQAMMLGSLENVEANVALMKSDEHRVHFTQAASSARSDLAAGVADLQHAVAVRRS